MSIEFEELKVLVVENVDLLGDIIETVLKSVNTKQVFVTLFAFTKNNGVRF